LRSVKAEERECVKKTQNNNNNEKEKKKKERKMQKCPKNFANECMIKPIA